MSGSVAVWVLWAVLLFWALGAYKRLVRLRAQAIAAFAPLDAQFGLHVALVKNSFSKADSDLAPAVEAGLVGAALQFESSMQVARAYPLDTLAMRALQTAYETLGTSWVRLRNSPPDLAGERLPEALQQQWEHLSLNTDTARAEFNQRVQDYNAAIGQFPARLLARIFRFRLAPKL
jgi:LemA protein